MNRTRKKIGKLLKILQQVKLASVSGLPETWKNNCYESEEMKSNYDNYQAEYLGFNEQK